MPVKLFAISRNVDPQASLSADGAGTLDLEPDLVVWMSAWWEVNVLSCNVG